MAHPVQPGSPEFEQAVADVLQRRLREVREHYAQAVHDAGFPDAAVFLRNYRDKPAGEGNRG